MKCNVCGEREAVGVFCSTTGAISFAYCQECLQSYREPYMAVVASLFGVSGMDGVAEWYRPIIQATLTAEGKTEQELFADVATLEQEYMEVEFRDALRMRRMANRDATDN